MYVVYDQKTAEYLAPKGRWVKDLGQAAKFKGPLRAWDAVRGKKVRMLTAVVLTMNEAERRPKAI